MDNVLWSYSSQQSVAIVDDQSTIKSTGTGTGYQADFYRRDSSLVSGDRAQIEFKSDSGNPRVYFSIAYGNERFGIYENGGYISSNYVDNLGNWVCPSNLLQMEANTWYIVSIHLDDDKGFVVDVWKRDNPAVRGSYTYTTGMSKGKSWYFRH